MYIFWSPGPRGSSLCFAYDWSDSFRWPMGSISSASCWGHKLHTGYPFYWRNKVILQVQKSCPSVTILKNISLITWRSTQAPRSICSLSHISSHMDLLYTHCSNKKSSPLPTDIFSCVIPDEHNADAVYWARPCNTNPKTWTLIPAIYNL